jgi:hypothetical protein
MRILLKGFLENSISKEDKQMFVSNRSYGKDIWVSIPIWLVSL